MAGIGIVDLQANEGETDEEVGEACAKSKRIEME